MLGSALLGALLLVLAEFTTLFTVRTATGATVTSVSTGSHDTYALLPIALVAGTLAFGAVRTGSRAALWALGSLGVLALLIALIGDLPDARATGAIGNPPSATAAATPAVGLYLETFGAIMVVVAAGCGLLLSRAASRGGAR